VSSVTDQDEVLLAQAIDGDPAPLRTLLERHGPRVWNEINADIAPHWRSVLDADDVMQVTYMEAFLQIRQLSTRTTAGFVGWLRRIANNNLRDGIKELERKKRPSPAMRVHAPVGGDSHVALVELLGAESMTPSRHVAKDEASRIVSAMLTRLPPDYGTVIRLYDIEGHNIAEVSAAMKRSTAAVHMLRARAHDRLREMLGAETDFFSQTS
jgi:RNA polymerase sigma factor (sigma-70 family)